MTEKIVRVTIDGNYKINKGLGNTIYFQNGIERLQSALGLADMDDSRIVDFVVYKLYIDRKALSERTWQLNFLFSDYSIGKFKRQFFSEEGKSGINYYIDLWLDEHGLSRGYLVRMISDKKPSQLQDMVYMVAEEAIKKRFYNTADGYALCQCATTGWSPLSQSCKGCKYWVECDRATTKKFPELMRYRKEYYGKQKK